MLLQLHLLYKWIKVLHIIYIVNCIEELRGFSTTRIHCINLKINILVLTRTLNLMLLKIAPFAISYVSKTI